MDDVRFKVAQHATKTIKRGPTSTRRKNERISSANMRQNEKEQDEEVEKQRTFKAMALL